MIQSLRQSVLIFTAWSVGATPAVGQTAAFESADSYSFGYRCRYIETGDVNGDGLPDLVVSRSNGQHPAINVRLNIGQMKFGPLITHSAGSVGFMRVADMDRDSDLDIVVENTAISVLYNDGSGAFSAPVEIVTPSWNPSSFVILDADGDQFPDIAVRTSEQLVRILLGSESGYTEGVSFGVSGEVIRLFKADIDRDGMDDLYWSSATIGPGPSPRFGVAISSGDGAFDPIHTYGTSGVEDIDAADFDRDGDLDLFLTKNTSFGFSSDMEVWSSGVNGTLSRILSLQPSFDSHNLAVADLTGNGTPEIVATSDSPGQIRILQRLGSSGYTETLTLSTGASSAWTTARADLDLDGDVDIVVANINHDTVAVFENLASRVQPPSVFAVDPRATFLHSCEDPDPGQPALPQPLKIELSSLRLSAGDPIELVQMGDFRFTPDDTEFGTGMLGVFSSTDVVDPMNSDPMTPEDLDRVPDAIDAGVYLQTGGPNRCPELNPIDSPDFNVDIPFDFSISDTDVVIPAGAAYLFVCANDEFWGDNSDQDGDFGVQVRKLTDLDEDGVWDHEDNAAGVYNPYDVDTDGDGTPDAQSDEDEDGVGDVIDNCILTPNPEQEDTDFDGIGDACDACDAPDPLQRDEDENGQFDACEIRDDPTLDCDLSGRLDSVEIAEGTLVDVDMNGVPDGCETDSDMDGIPDILDTAPNDPEPVPDSDGDGVADTIDNAPSIPNPDQLDFDGDGIGDVRDNCMYVANPTQADSDGDGYGDACNACDESLNPPLRPEGTASSGCTGQPVIDIDWEFILKTPGTGDLIITRPTPSIGRFISFVGAVADAAYDSARLEAGLTLQESPFPALAANANLLLRLRSRSPQSALIAIQDQLGIQPEVIIGDADDPAAIPDVLGGIAGDLSAIAYHLGPGGGWGFNGAIDLSWCDRIRVDSGEARVLEVPVSAFVTPIVAESFGDIALTKGRVTIELSGFVGTESFSQELDVESVTVFPPNVGDFDLGRTIPVPVDAGTTLIDVELTARLKLEVFAKGVGTRFNLITGSANAAVAPIDFEIGNFRAAGGGPLPSGVNVGSCRSGMSYSGGCPGDGNADKLVDFIDLEFVLDNWGAAVAPGFDGDVNRDGVVNFADLELVLNRWAIGCD